MLKTYPLVLKPGVTRAEMHDLIRDLWWFIENVGEETPDRTDRFFALRERVRGITSLGQPLAAENFRALYILEPIGVGGALEANGTVYFFCSEECRSKFITERITNEKYRLGEDADAIPDTVCDLCEKPLT